MTDIVTVLWHMNTYTSAATSHAAEMQKVLLQYNNDPGFRSEFTKWCKKRGLSINAGMKEVAQDWLVARNKRSAFTGLNSEQRLNELEAAVAKARYWASKEMGAPDLVFVAPEYLFAKDGYRHLLDADQVDNIKARLKAISKKFHQVLLFPGTVAFRQSIQGNSVKARATLYDDINFWKANATGYKANWVDSNKDKVHAIAMRGPDFDVAQNKAFAYLNSKKFMEYTKRGDFHEVTAQDATGNEVYVPGKKTGTLQAFGKSFGTEVCLDHNMGYAQTAGGIPPDIHVILSAAVVPKAENENTQGKNAGKTGFVIHASCERKYTSVIQWSDAKRSVVDPIWESGTGYGGTLLGYKLNFNPKKADQGLAGVEGRVAAMKKQFGG